MLAVRSGHPLAVCIDVREGSDIRCVLAGRDDAVARHRGLQDILSHQVLEDNLCSSVVIDVH